jgi:hypothetical protein
VFGLVFDRFRHCAAFLSRFFLYFKHKTKERFGTSDARALNPAADFDNPARKVLKVCGEFMCFQPCVLHPIPDETEEYLCPFKLAAIVPHPPIILPQIGQGRSAKSARPPPPIARLQRRVRQLAPDTL